MYYDLMVAAQLEGSKAVTAQQASRRRPGGPGIRVAAAAAATARAARPRRRDAALRGSTGDSDSGRLGRWPRPGSSINACYSPAFSTKIAQLFIVQYSPAFSENDQYSPASSQALLLCCFLTIFSVIAGQ
jgi:hypothetical protein